MPVGPKVKVALKEALEEGTKLVLNQTVKVLEAQTEDSQKPVWSTVVMGLKTINGAFLQELADRINPADNG